MPCLRDRQVNQLSILLDLPMLAHPYIPRAYLVQGGRLLGNLAGIPHINETSMRVGRIPMHMLQKGKGQGICRKGKQLYKESENSARGRIMNTQVAWRRNTLIIWRKGIHRFTADPQNNENSPLGCDQVTNLRDHHHMNRFLSRSLIEGSL
jgi:hypothetical protein